MNMDESNPYDAPQAQVQAPEASAPKLSMAQMLLGAQGRIGRRQYWLYTCGFGSAWLVGMGLIGVTSSILGMRMPDEGSGIISIVVGLGYMPVMWVFLALQAKRWHDRDKSAWWLLLNWVPLLNLWGVIEAGFLEGTRGPNRYGADPKA